MDHATDTGLADGLYDYHIFDNDGYSCREIYGIVGVKDEGLVKLFSVSTSSDSPEDNSLGRIGFLSINQAIKFHKVYGRYVKEFSSEEVVKFDL